VAPHRTEPGGEGGPLRRAGIHPSPLSSPSPQPQPPPPKPAEEQQQEEEGTVECGNPGLLLLRSVLLPNPVPTPTKQRAGRGGGGEEPKPGHESRDLCIYAVANIIDGSFYVDIKKISSAIGGRERT